MATKSPLTLFVEKTRTEAQVSFLEMAQEFLTKNPTVKHIAWEQYTPTFNDGDPCEFTMGDLKFLVEKTSESEDEDGEPIISEVEVDSYEFARGSVYRSLSEEFHSLKEFFYWLFGDNKRVIVTPAEIITEDYDCQY
jgi:hypothetical protein